MALLPLLALARRFGCLLFITCVVFGPAGRLAHAQITTSGFSSASRPEAPGTLLSHPSANGSEPIGRTTSLNYLNGWLIVGGEVPGSRAGSDLVLRVYDIANPTNPVRRHPSDFNLTYPNNRWHQGNVGWNAHGTAQSGDLLLPNVLRVSSFGGPVELGGTNGIPDLARTGVGYNRSSQAGPWVASFPWYGSPDENFVIQRVTTPNGWNHFQTLATFDHVGPYGGGDWHPMFFGDLLIYARSGPTGRDGVVVYRLQYNNFDDPAARSITPHYVGSLQGGFQGYWPALFSDGSGLYVIGSSTNILLAADITRAADPAADGSVTLAASLTLPQFTNASYPVFQDNHGFIHNRKIDMTRFLAGDANPVALTLNEGAPNNVDTSQMSLVLGNLWLTGGYPHNHGADNYRAQGMAVWVHQQAPDTTAPRVSYHIPQANRTHYPRHAPLSFLLHEHSRAGGPRNGVDFTVRPVLANDTLGAPVSGYLIHDFSGVLTFTPTAGLDADTTYQVNFLSSNNGTPSNRNDDIGFMDAAGNLIEPYSFRFSTGGGIDATPPPVFTSLTANTYQPAPATPVTVTAAATGTGALQYRFNFDGAWSAWSSTAHATHAYATAGRPRVLVQIRDAAGNITNGSLRLLVIVPPTGPAPTHSTTLAVGNDPHGRRLWVVNPDAHTVSVLDAATGEKLAEHSTGADSNPRSIARDAFGRYWVTCHGTDQLRVFNSDGSVHATVPLAYGAAPFGVAASPDGQSIFVTLHGSAQLLRYAAANPSAAPVARATFPTPRALAVSGNGQRVFVTRFISTDLEAEVAEFAAASASLTHARTITLSSANTTDGGDRAAGVPNYLAAIALSPDGTRAAIASKQDNVQRGLLYGVGDLTHETSVRAVVSFINLVSNQEIRDSRRDLDNSDSPSALAYTPLGDTLLVALQGNNRVVGLDALSLAPVPGNNTVGATQTSPAVITFDLASGLAPQGLLLDPTSSRLFTQNFMGRSVTVRDAFPLLVENRTTLPLLATTPTVASESLAPDVLLGKQVFYNAADPRMSADSYISCATCHVDGGTDGRVWDFTGRGEGLRRTTDLRGRSGLAQGNVHWSANFDEIQDFEHDIRGPFGGTGFLPLTPQQFSSLHPSPASGKAGLSPELDALAAYVASLGPATTPRSPARNANGSLTAAALRGRAVFAAQSCTDCHSGPALTDSLAGNVSTRTLHDVGTLSGLSGLRLGGALEGIDTPTLHGLHANRNHLHHGLADTLADVFSYAGGALHLAANGQRITPASVSIQTDDASQGGGGFLRGALGGTYAAITAGSPTPGVRFTFVDGGLSGGTARISFRYVRQYYDGTARLRINGVEQTVPVLRQFPDNSWMTSGWRWATVTAPLLAGPHNTIEILRGDDNLQLNALLVANTDDLLAAHPHRRVGSLPTADRDDLFAYLRQLDYRDDHGVPLTAPGAPAPAAPTILTPPVAQTLAVGNTLSLHVSVGGTGPFTYQWFRGNTPVGTNSPTFEQGNVQLAHAGAYTVRISNAVDTVTTAPVQIVVNSALAITTTSTLPAAIAGQPYAVALAATGGVGARGWTLDAGTLPTGLTLSANGNLTGTPTAGARAVPFTVRLTDSSGSVTRAFTLDVTPPGGFSADPDLVLHYTFDERSGTRVWDASPAGNNHATDVPGASWTAHGRIGGGAYGSTNLAASLAPFFPANQDDLNFDPRSQPFTFSVWIRTTTPTSYRTLFSKDGNAAENWRTQFRLWTTENPVTNLQGASARGWSNNIPAAGLNNGQWHLLTFVNFQDGATWRTRLYHNGGATYTQWNTGTVDPVPQLLRIGDTTHGGNPWHGQLDDLRIYKRALTPSEITALYNVPVAESYDNWISTLPTAIPSNRQARTADPDGDGVPNLLEYALGGDPMNAADAPKPRLVRTANTLGLTYPRARSGLIYTVEISTTLAHDSWTAVGVTQDTTTPVGNLATATVLHDPSVPQRFLRLRVSEP